MKALLNAGLLAAVLATGASASAAGLAAATAKVIHIDIRSFAFGPANVIARVGDIIEWTNRDFAPHTATDVAGKWTTPTLNKDATARITVKTAGTINYFCKFHPQMKGVLSVAGNSAKGVKKR